MNVRTCVAPSNVQMPLYVKRKLNVKKISTLHVKIDAICDTINSKCEKNRLSKCFILFSHIEYFFTDSVNFHI